MKLKFVLLFLTCLIILLADSAHANENGKNGAKNNSNGKKNNGGQKNNNAKASEDPPTRVPKAVDGNKKTPFFTADFCKKSGLEVANGKQLKAGVCSSTPQGQIPAFEKMSSTLIIEPQFGSRIDASKNFTVTIALRNLDTGFFDDPQNQYYLFPQTLNKNGIIEGHLHVTVEHLGNARSPPDPTKFEFFKGLNAQSPDGKTLSTVVDASRLKSNGLYRICSMSGSFSHQPLVMPVAQRGAQDDCIRVNIFNAGKQKQQSNNNTNNNKNNNSQKNKNAKGNGKSGQGKKFNRRSHSYA